MTVPQFWHVSYPNRPDEYGSISYSEDIGENEQDARARAIMYSHRYGHATVTNREGLVATYVYGNERHYNQ